MAERVRITDVSPRDGLQNEPGVIPTTEKVRLVELLCETGVDEVEVSSFVSPKWVPQLGDAGEVFAQVAELPAVREGRAPMLSALVPNEKGMQAALSVNELTGRRLIGKVSVFTAASEEFSRRNINASIAESIERFVRVVELAHSSGLLVRGYISCAFGCPFTGRVDPTEVGRVAEMLDRIGIDEFDIADTIGAARPDLDPDVVEDVLQAVLAKVTRRDGHAYPPHRVTFHFHDTLGLAARSVNRALGFVRSFDGSVAGLGGCPYASTPGKRAPGNISTELLVRTVHEAGYETGVDLDKLAVAAEYARAIVSKARAQAAGGGA